MRCLVEGFGGENALDSRVALYLGCDTFDGIQRDCRISGGADMSEHSVGPVRRALAVMCHHCPFCRYGRANPESLLGKVMHHRLHADYCPMWKSEKAVYGPEQEAGPRDGG